VRLVRSAPPAVVAERVTRSRDRNPRLRYGLRLRLVGRAEASEARDAADRILDDGRSGPAGDAVVGTYDEVARRLFAYRQLGIDEFVLYGCTGPGEPARVAGEILPRLRALTDAAAVCGA
jgi:alkanesulfonate monooxygenase